MKNLLKIISLVTLISLSGCKGNTSTNSSNSNVNSNSVSTNSSSSLHAPEGTIQYKVQVLLPNGEKAGEGLQVQWCDDTNCFSANTDANGVATTFLAPKEYDVHIYNYAETYACELGLKSNEDNASIEVKLQDILSYKGGNGSIEDPYIAHEGVYNVTLSDIDTEAKVASPVFVGFVPNRPGKYIIESWTENTDSINTNVGYYGSNPHFYPEVPDISDDDNGDTDNFKLEFNIGIEEFVNTGEYDVDGNLIYEKDANGNYVSGGVYRFGIGATNIRREKSFPIVIKYLEHYETPKIIVDEVPVTETLTKCEDNNDGKVWKDCKLNGLDTVVYNEETSSYHLENEDGYKLYAKITQPALPYIDKAFTEVEDAGSNALTLDNGTKSYTKFIDTYAEYCNSDGVYPLTNELKTFLELYFNKNADWISSVSENVVDNEYGWLFAVGYYADLADLYDKPWSGTGAQDEAYSINPGTYLADITENDTVYYIFGPKITLNESLYRVKTTEPNLEFVGLDEYGVTVKEEENVKYFDITLGGMINSSSCLFGIKASDGAASKLVFTLEAREKTVEPDQIQLGENTIEILKGGYVTCKFKAPTAGTFVITSTEENAWFFYGNDDYNGNDGEISFSVECAANDVIEFDVLTVDGEADFITFNVLNSASIKLGINSVEVNAWETKEADFIAPEDGTYRFTPLDDNSSIGYNSNGVTSFYPSEDGEYFEVELQAGESLTILITTADYSKGTVRFRITKI